MHQTEKAMAPLAWKIPWTEEPGRLQSMGLRRVRHDLVTERLQQHTLLVGIQIGVAIVRMSLVAQR